jgi:hypothetical protein
MSMKRTKQRSDDRDKNVATDFWAKPVEPEKTWDQQTEGKDDDAYAAYSMSARYAKGALISHPKFGKGVVVESEANRVEILFQDGKKKLGHGQTS